jgi:hypothetical protein
MVERQTPVAANGRQGEPGTPQSILSSGRGLPAHGNRGCQRTGNRLHTTEEVANAAHGHRPHQHDMSLASGQTAICAGKGLSPVPAQERTAFPPTTPPSDVDRCFLPFRGSYQTRPRSHRGLDRQVGDCPGRDPIAPSSNKGVVSRRPQAIRFAAKRETVLLAHIPIIGQNG